MNKIGAGDLRKLVAFEAPNSQPDGSGGTIEGWDAANAIQAMAHFRYLRGGEAVQAARLEGKQPAVITIHNTLTARSITASWRMRDIASNQIYNIRSNPIPTDDDIMLEITVESGVAV